MVTSSRDVHRTLTEERQSVAHTQEYLREQQRGLKRRRTALQHAHHKWSDDMKTFRTRQVCVCAGDSEWPPANWRVKIIKYNLQSTHWRGGEWNYINERLRIGPKSSTGKCMNYTKMQTYRMNMWPEF